MQYEITSENTKAINSAYIASITIGLRNTMKAHSSQISSTSTGKFISPRFINRLELRRAPKGRTAKTILDASFGFTPLSRTARIAAAINTKAVLLYIDESKKEENLKAK
jgi:hypothetical protein